MLAAQWSLPLLARTAGGPGQWARRGRGIPWLLQLKPADGVRAGGMCAHKLLTSCHHAPPGSVRAPVPHRAAQLHCVSDRHADSMAAAQSSSTRCALPCHAARCVARCGSAGEQLQQHRRAEPRQRVLVRQQRVLRHQHHAGAAARARLLRRRKRLRGTGRVHIHSHVRRAPRTHSLTNSTKHRAPRARPPVHPDAMHPAPVPTRLPAGRARGLGAACHTSGVARRQAGWMPSTPKHAFPLPHSKSPAPGSC